MPAPLYLVPVENAVVHGRARVAFSSESRAATAYRHAFVVTDFSTTADAFHRRLTDLAQAVAPNLSLVQYPPSGDCEHDASATEIMLEGLRHRLGLDARRCAVLAETSDPARLVGRCTNIVVLGAHGQEGECTGPSLTDLERRFACDVVVIEDHPEWD